jgi:hypothetical protein
MTKRLNDASADEWTKASIKWKTNLNSHEYAESIDKHEWFDVYSDRETLDFHDYIAKEKANFWASDDELTEYEFSDNVNNPSHYNQGGIECIEYIKQVLGENFGDYCQGNVTKYLHRWRYKNGIEDLRKAQWYLNEMLKHEEEIGE